MFLHEAQHLSVKKIICRVIFEKLVMSYQSASLGHQTGLLNLWRHSQQTSPVGFWPHTEQEKFRKFQCNFMLIHNIYLKFKGTNTNRFYVASALQHHFY